MMVSDVTHKIVNKRARFFYYNSWKFIHRWCDVEDLVQSIYERLVKDGLLNCQEFGLIYTVANRACIDYLRMSIPYFRQKKPITEEEWLVEYETAASRVFDSKWYEIISLQQLLDKFPEREKYLTAEYMKGKTLKEIGYDLKVTESRVCQLKGVIIARLNKLYAMEEVSA